MTWEYVESEWLRTREVEVFGNADSEGTTWYWRRARTGPDGKVVATSGPFKELKWAVLSAIKENYPLAPTVTQDQAEEGGFRSVNELFLEIDTLVEALNQDPV